MRPYCAISAFVLVAGCAAPAQRPMQIQVYPAGTAPRTNTVNFDQTKGALSGQVQRIESEYNITPTCESEGDITIKIVTPPTNGRLFVEKGKAYPNFVKDNVRFPCNSKEIPATILNYQSNTGFVGIDTARVEVIFASGEYRSMFYTINVR